MQVDSTVVVPTHTHLEKFLSGNRQHCRVLIRVIGPKAAKLAMLLSRDFSKMHRRQELPALLWVHDHAIDERPNRNDVISMHLRPLNLGCIREVVSRFESAV